MKITQPTRAALVAQNAPATGVTYVDTGGYFGGGTLTLADILAILGAGSAPDAFLTNTLGGKDKIQDLGTLGASATCDLNNASVFQGVMDVNPTIGFTGWTNLRRCTIGLSLTEDGPGGNTPTLTGVTWIGGTPTWDTTAGTTTHVILFSDDGGTTIWGAIVGDLGLTIKDEGGSLATAATSIDFVGAGVVASGTGAAKTVTIAGGATTLDDLTDVTLTTPALRDRLRFDGTVWRNSALIWRPVTVFDPTTGNYLPLVDGSGNQIMAEA